jgi:hypothetical protein
MLAGESLAIAERMRRALVARFGEADAAARFRAFDTICSATQERQDALHGMLEQHGLDVLLVIGGYNSSNTTHLLEIGAAKGVPTFHIQDAPASPARTRSATSRSTPSRRSSRTTGSRTVRGRSASPRVPRRPTRRSSASSAAWRKFAGSSRRDPACYRRRPVNRDAPEKDLVSRQGSPARRRPAAARKRPSGAPAAKVVVDRLGPLHAEIVVVGRELLRGQLRDGNAAWIAGELTRRGAWSIA